MNKTDQAIRWNRLPGSSSNSIDWIASSLEISPYLEAERAHEEAWTREASTRVCNPPVRFIIKPRVSADERMYVHLECNIREKENNRARIRCCAWTQPGSGEKVTRSWLHWIEETATSSCNRENKNFTDQSHTRWKFSKCNLTKWKGNFWEIVSRENVTD